MNKAEQIISLFEAKFSISRGGVYQIRTVFEKIEIITVVWFEGDEYYYYASDRDGKPVGKPLLYSIKQKTITHAKEINNIFNKFDGMYTPYPEINKKLAKFFKKLGKDFNTKAETDAYVKIMQSDLPGPINVYRG
jgi:hypothetical protein